MGAFEFLAEFKALHDKVKNGTLPTADRPRYEMARSQFARMVLVAQQLGHTGQTLRSSLRMAKMLKVELRPDEGEPARGSTIDLASGGFAVLLPNGLRVGKKAGFTLYLPGAGGGTAPISGRVVVASSRPQTSLFRVSFHFDNLEPRAAEQLDVALIDAVLERFAHKM
ncbi:MAG: PilZ domain-containing protein [Labilithrix sp.]|nr:PilZ domain-containing protein [Labilithrix sp.]MBX3220045.1 PilZ domain-containing protein [Labilithrix sp.]